MFIKKTYAMQKIYKSKFNIKNYYLNDVTVFFMTQYKIF